MEGSNVKSDETVQKTQTEHRKRVLAPGTPSPSEFEGWVIPQVITCFNIGKRRHVEEPTEASKSLTNGLRRPELPTTLQPGASNVLKALKLKSGDSVDAENVGADLTPIEPSTSGRTVNRDSESLTIIENLEIGPYQHAAPDKDPNFSTLEPHSSIRLS
jgi:hypothetical protein